MIYRSPHPDIQIPEQSFSEFVLDESRGRDADPALADGVSGRIVTYGELRKQVKRIAAGLAELGIRKGDVVGLCTGNCPEFAIALHAATRIGAAVTTVNPTNTSHDLARQLMDTGARMLITAPALLGKARDAIKESNLDIDLLTTDEAAGVTSLASIARDHDPPQVRIDPGTDIAVLPCSSGTTGLPKAVMLTHRNLVANLLQCEAVERGQPRVFLGVLPFFHIYGLIAILNYSLIRGASIVTLPRFELEQFLKTIQDWRVTHIHIVPPIAIALAKHPVVDKYDLSRLQEIFCGAAPLGADVSNAVQERLQVTIKQGYGMTEASPVTHLTDVHRPIKAGTVGHLVSLTEGRVVSVDSATDVAVGEAGEVWVRGPQVMKGYLNNPEATQRTVDADGWLHTGDIGYVDRDGYLTIVDRLKELIKVKAFQVAPAELEAYLLKHPQIADAAVIPVADDECGEVPKAIIVSRGELSAAAVMEFVNSQVAHYKRIRSVEFVAAIPKSASGKILRRVLVDQERHRPK
jgi:acyl-CoA synthetase (AMP-forming)/AMP-acid ligase II